MLWSAINLRAFASGSRSNSAIGTESSANRGSRCVVSVESSYVSAVQRIVMTHQINDSDVCDTGLAAHLELWGITPTSVERVRRSNGQIQVVFRFIGTEEFRLCRKAFYSATRSGHELIKKHTELVAMVRQMKKDTNE
jgi:hypothetical protein